jgi:RNA polymerase sigma factor (sigma-70 family)
MTKQDLARAAAAGDNKALETLLASSRSIVRSCLRERLQRYPDCQIDEAEQEVNIKIWQNLGRFDESLASWSTWIFKIADNVAIDIHRHATAAKRPQTVSIEELASKGEWLPEREDGTPTPERCLAAKQELTLLFDRITEELGEDLAYALALKASGFSAREIAKQTNVSRWDATQKVNRLTQHLELDPDAPDE